MSGVVFAWAYVALLALGTAGLTATLVREWWLSRMQDGSRDVGPLFAAVAVLMAGAALVRVFSWLAGLA